MTTHIGATLGSVRADYSEMIFVSADHSGEFTEEPIMDLPSEPRETVRVLIAGSDLDRIAAGGVFPAPLAVSVDIAANGAEALEWWGLRRYHLIVLGLEMLVMDGWAAAREIRRRERESGLEHVPLLAFTEGDAALPAECGFDGRLTKPLEAAQLHAAIVKWARPPNPHATPADESIAARRPLYLANRRHDGEKMRNALAVANFNAIRIIGHNCKGTGAGYGFPEIGTAGAAIEMAAKASDVDGLRSSIGHFERLVEAAHHLL